MVLLELNKCRGRLQRATCANVRLLLLAACALGASGCLQKEEGFQLVLSRIDVPACGQERAGGTTARPRPVLPTGEYTLRVTFLRRTANTVSAGNIRSGFEPACWRIIPRGGEADLMLPPGDDDQRYSLLVEAFRDGKLAYAGRRDNVQVQADRRTTVFLRPTQDASWVYEEKNATGHMGFSCVDPMRFPRAFHSATLLPNGEVLVYGGLANDTGQGVFKASDTVAYAVGTVEIYQPNYAPEDSANLSFKVAQGTLPRRAFHHTVLLPSPAAGPYRLLVMGGLQPKAADAPVVFLTSPGTPFMFTPHDEAVAGLAMLVTYDPVSGSVEHRDLPSLPRAMFPATAVQGEQLVIAGGAATWDASAGPVHGFYGGRTIQRIALAEGKDPELLQPAATMGATRVGHAMALLGADNYLIVGGQMDGQETDDGELLATGASSTSVFPLATAGQSATVWHTLTPLGSTDADLAQATNLPSVALWAGGFVLTTATPHLRETGPKPVPRPQDQTLQLIPLGASPVAKTIPASAAADFQTSGYHSATRLHDGSVMLVGGKLGDERNKCGIESPYCASNQVVIYEKSQDSLRTKSPATGSWALSVPSLGHRATRLLDGNVLITGGITLVTEKSQGQALVRSELFNPRRGAPEEDWPLGRGPASDQDQAPPVQRCEDRY